MKVIKTMKFDNQIQPSSLHVLSREEPGEQWQQGSSVIYLVLAGAKTKVLPLGKKKKIIQSPVSQCLTWLKQIGVQNLST